MIEIAPPRAKKTIGNRCHSERLKRCERVKNFPQHPMSTTNELTMVLSVVARCMSGEEEKMSLEIWCDLLEAELKRALEDLSVIRGLDKAQAKSKSHMLKEALDKAVAENFRTATGIETRPAR
jgi:hypothetical protein